MLDVVRHFGTSTNVLHVSTDVGPAYIKPFCREVHPHHLVREVVGLVIAKEVGLVTPEWEVIRPVIEVEIGNRMVSVLPGPHLFMRPIDVWSSGPRDLERGGFQHLADPADAGRLVVVDTILRNWDRQDCADYTTGTLPTTNWSNVFYMKSDAGRVLVGMDFSHCMPSPSGVGSHLSRALIETASDPGVYGLVPGVVDHLSRASLTHALEAMADWLFDEKTPLIELLESVPEEWWLSRNEAANVLQYLRDRTAYLRGERGALGFAKRVLSAVKKEQGG